MDSATLSVSSVDAVKTLSIKEVSNAAKTHAGSIKYLKSVVPLSLFQLVYNRVNFDKKHFSPRTLKGWDYVCLNKDHQHKELTKLYGFAYSAMEALQKSCLHHLYLKFSSKETSKLIEHYRYSFSYYQGENTPLKPKGKGNEIITLTRNWFQEINSLSDFPKISNDIKISLEIVLINSPENYIPTNFEVGDETKLISLKEKTKYIAVGEVNTGFHRVKCYGALQTDPEDGDDPEPEPPIQELPQTPPPTLPLPAILPPPPPPPTTSTLPLPPTSTIPLPPPEMDISSIFSDVTLVVHRKEATATVQDEHNGTMMVEDDHNRTMLGDRPVVVDVSDDAYETPTYDQPSETEVEVKEPVLRRKGQVISRSVVEDETPMSTIYSVRSDSEVGDDPMAVITGTTSPTDDLLPTSGVDEHMYCVCELRTTYPTIEAVQCGVCDQWQHAPCMGFRTAELSPCEYKCWRCNPTGSRACGKMNEDGQMQFGRFRLALMLATTTRALPQKILAKHISKQDCAQLVGKLERCGIFVKSKNKLNRENLAIVMNKCFPIVSRKRKISQVQIEDSEMLE